MAIKKGAGLLLIMVDVSADKDEEFNRWYNEEHLGVILALPGFLNAARYKAVLGGPKYLACYELESAAAMETPEFAHQRANRTEWAQKIGTTAIGTNLVVNLYQQIFPIEVSQTVAQSDMAPVLQIGRMGVPAEDEGRFNQFYNTVYAPNYAKVSGCIRFRRYSAVRGEPKFSTVYELEHDKVSMSPDWEAARRASGGMLSDFFPRMKHAAGSPGIYTKIFQLGACPIDQRSGSGYC